MTQQVFCLKLQKTAPGLSKPPYPGAVGQKIYTSISQEAWLLWKEQQTMLINEYRLNVLEPEARKFLEAEMEKFLFGTGSEKPPGYQESLT